MRAALLCLCLLVTAASANECKKRRPLTKPEADFYAQAKSHLKALPPAPKGWEQHPEEIAPPTELCVDNDGAYQNGDYRFNVLADTEYRDPTDRHLKMEPAIKAAEPTAAETKKASELYQKLEGLSKELTQGGVDDKKMAKLGPQIKAIQAELQKQGAAQTARGNKAVHAAGLDSAARIRVSFNPQGEGSVGCANPKTLTATKVAGVDASFSGTCDVSSAPQDAESGVLLLFGTWATRVDGTSLTATPTFNPQKPHHAIQTLSVLVTGDGTRAEELAKAIDVKALAALIGK